MKNLLSLALLCFVSSLCFAQEVPKPEFENLPYLWNKNSDKMTLLLKETVEVKAEDKTSYKFSGTESRTKISSSDNFSILIDTNNPTLLKAFKIYKLNVKGKSRQVTIITEGMKGDKMRDEYVIDYNIKNISGGIHELVISAQLEQGQYMLTNGMNTYTFSVN